MLSSLTAKIAPVRHVSPPTSGINPVGALILLTNAKANSRQKHANMGEGVQENLVLYRQVRRWLQSMEV